MVGAVHARRLVSRSSNLLCRALPTHLLCCAYNAGRVAAGAIAEKYLKMAYGIEIVAFVSSVGKVHLPSSVSPPSQVPAEDDETVEDALSPEFVELLKTVTREQVDAQPTRCPHAETSERMTKVNQHFLC